MWKNAKNNEYLKTFMGTTGPSWSMEIRDKTLLIVQRKIWIIIPIVSNYSFVVLTMQNIITKKTRAAVPVEKECSNKECWAPHKHTVNGTCNQLAVHPRQRSQFYEIITIKKNHKRNRTDFPFSLPTIAFTDSGLDVLQTCSEEPLLFLR